MYTIDKGVFVLFLFAQIICFAIPSFISENFCSDLIKYSLISEPIIFGSKSLFKLTGFCDTIIPKIKRKVNTIRIL